MKSKHLTRKAKSAALETIEEDTTRALVRNLINDLVNTSDSFDPELVSELLSILKTRRQPLTRKDTRFRRLPVVHLRWSYDLIWKKLRQKHSQLRWMCVQLIEKLFVRSARVRKWIVNDLEEFVSLCICPPCGPNDVIAQLPPPTAFASLLRNKSIRFIHEWSVKYGVYYKKLSMCWSTLCKDMQGECERVLKNLQQLEDFKMDRLKLETIKIGKKVKHAQELLKESKLDISMNLTQAREAINLIIKAKEEELEAKQRKDELRASSSKSVSFLPEGEDRFMENADNRAVINNLDESLKLLKREKDTTLARVREILSELSAQTNQELIRPHSIDLSCLKSEIVEISDNIESIEKEVEYLNIVRIRSGIDEESMLKLQTQNKSRKRSNKDTSSGNSLNTSVGDSKKCKKSDQAKADLSTPSSSSKDVMKTDDVNKEGIKSNSESEDENEGVEESESDFEDVAEKEGIEFMSSADIANAVGDEETTEQSQGTSDVTFAVPNPNYNPDRDKKRGAKSTRRKKRKLVKKKLEDNTSRKRIAKKLKLHHKKC